MKTDLPPGPLRPGTATASPRTPTATTASSTAARTRRPGSNVNAIILEIPLAFLTKRPQKDRIVNAWGESWVLKAARKIETIPDDPLWPENPVGAARRRASSTTSCSSYKLVDTDGQPFADAGLSEREDNRQLGANNFWLARRLRHAASATSAGASGRRSARSACGTCFDHDDAPVLGAQDLRAAPSTAFPRVKKCLFQELQHARRLVEPEAA